MSQTNRADKVLLLLLLQCNCNSLVTWSTLKCCRKEILNYTCGSWASLCTGETMSEQCFNNIDASCRDIKRIDRYNGGVRHSATKKKKQKKRKGEQINNNLFKCGIPPPITEPTGIANLLLGGGGLFSFAFNNQWATNPPTSLSFL